MTNDGRPTLRDLRASVTAKEGRIAGLRVEWVRRPWAITYPTGLQGYRATVRISAPGYRPTVRNLLGDSEGWRF